MRYVNDHRIPLEVCLTSNVQTRAVPTRRQHPFRHLLRPGPARHPQHRQPADVGTTVSRRDRAGRQGVQAEPYEVKRIVINGFKSAFLPYAQKARMLREVSLEIDRVFMEAFPEDYDRAASVL